MDYLSHCETLAVLFWQSNVIFSTWFSVVDWRSMLDFQIKCQRMFYLLCVLKGNELKSIRNYYYIKLPALWKIKCAVHLKITKANYTTIFCKKIWKSSNREVSLCDKSHFHSLYSQRRESIEGLNTMSPPNWTGPLLLKSEVVILVGDFRNRNWRSKQYSTFSAGHMEYPWARSVDFRQKLI